jgi:hypothetical protein
MFPSAIQTIAAITSRAFCLNRVMTILNPAELGRSILTLVTGCFRYDAPLPAALARQADPRVTNSMETLKAMTAKLGTPKLEGTEAVGGREAPALYFGTTKINNTFDIVDAVGTAMG